MDFDRLTEPSGVAGWGEPAVVHAFDASWDRELFGLAIPSWRKSVVALVQRAHRHFGGGRIVVADIGCGCASYARHLMEAGLDFEYHGYDHNEAVLRAACRRWAFLPSGDVHLHLMDARRDRWPIEDGRFDVVIWDTTLRFCEHVAVSLAESARVCRGWIILARTPMEPRAWCEQVHYYDMETASANWHFDRAWLAELAERNGLQLTTEVGRDDTQVFSKEPWPEALSIAPAARLERAFHEGYVRERVARLFAKRPEPWVVYGAGEHSRWLMSILPEALRGRIDCFVDDHAPPGGSIRSVAVVAPGEIDPENLGGILVSSDVIEEVLHRRAVQWGGAVPVHRLYHTALPKGPYDKVPVAFEAAGGMPRRKVAPLADRLAASEIDT